MASENDALHQAMAISRRAAALGFDWPDESGPRAKIDEEIAEIDTATTAAERQEEFGDLLFSVVNWARHLDVEPEVALRAANAKFQRRFAFMEQYHAECGDGTSFAALSQDALEGLWQQAKLAE